MTGVPSSYTMEDLGNYDEDVLPESSSIPGPAENQRHAQPSGPWPWVDVDNIDEKPDPSDRNTLEEGSPAWRGYPQSLFPNWTPAQVRRCGIKEAVDKKQELPCRIYCVDVLNDGAYETRDVITVPDNQESRTDFWSMINTERPAGIRVRALCVESMSGPVLQMLGSKYIIEPFFFSSSLNWIPSRYQEEVPKIEGDHITITLTFLRSIPDPAYATGRGTSRASFDSVKELPSLRGDPAASLKLSSSRVILRQDLLAIHMIRAGPRSPQGSTILSYHPDPEWRTTSAKILHTRIKMAGESVYWQGILKKASDPTFVLLTIMWHALYTWDNALEALYAHISWLEAKVIRTNDLTLTTELHLIRAHLLHYDSLLVDFYKSIVFIRDTPNPAMNSDVLDRDEKGVARQILLKECGNILSEIERLERSRDMQNKRLKNVMNLVFSSVNIEDSKRMQALTEASRDDSQAMKTLTQAAVGDSAAMKQIAYLTMVFLPASFVAGVFGMNVTVVNPSASGTLSHYFATAIPLTLVTIWIVIAFQSRKYFGGPDGSILVHLLWPYIFTKRYLAQHNGRWVDRKKSDDCPA